MVLVSLPDIAGDNAAHQIAASGTARTVILGVSSGSVRLGDSNVTASRGVAIGTAGFVLPQASEERIDQGTRKARERASLAFALGSRGYREAVAQGLVR